MQDTRLPVRSDAWKAQARRQLRNTSAPVYVPPAFDWSLLVAIIVYAALLMAFFLLFQYAAG